MKTKVRKIYNERFDYNFCCGGDYCDNDHDEEVKKDILEFADDLDLLYRKEMENQKTCSICKKVKSLHDFYFQKNSGLYEYRCKGCKHDYYIENREINLPKKREYQRKYYKTERGGKLKRATSRKMYRKHQERWDAKRIIKEAVNSGKIKILNCEVCNSSKTEGHHPDYSKPLVVRWLCTKHHRDLHRKFKGIDLLSHKKTI